MRNTFKYCGIYTPGSQPEFFEEDVFRTVIPLKTVGVIKDTNVYDAVSDAVKERLGKELAFIITHSGISLEELKKEFHIKRATAQRDMKQLKDIGWVDFVGAPKTGKYMLTEQGEKQFGNRPLYPGQDSSDQ
ncbi:HTH domain-containing protein [Sinomicrobium soli]|uniref:HTH domain-containing protein n=1 Tax=Sinomicrobium sp. N-1-3-6 TaxID=2219864 RepID=UPI00191BFC2A|nr:HTH domain-containing protein [Sinomicrobium sp. N-1-3-6]